MPNIGPTELIIVLVIFILLFGAKKLPDLGSSVGKSIRNFKKGVSDGKEGQEDVAGASQATIPPVTAQPTANGSVPVPPSTSSESTTLSRDA